MDPTRGGRRSEYGRSPQRATTARTNYKVEWAPEKFRELQAAYMWAETPTTKQIRYAEEEFWVLEAAVQRDCRGEQGQHRFAQFRRSPNR